MAKRNTDVTETELVILTMLWEHGRSTVRQIVQELYHEHTPALHATVGSLLDRLAAKGHVAADRSEFAHRYYAKIDRQEFVGEQLRQMAETHFGGSLSPMLLTLVNLTKLKKLERETIRKIIEGIE
jgi:BlaI family transcriptional regulator, penicillinase repressor